MILHLFIGKIIKETVSIDILGEKDGTTSRTTLSKQVNNSFHSLTNVTNYCVVIY